MTGPLLIYAPIYTGTHSINKQFLTSHYYMNDSDTKLIKNTKRWVGLKHTAFCPLSKRYYFAKWFCRSRFDELDEYLVLKTFLSSK